VQVPDTQVWLPQASGEPHVAVTSHVSVELPEHCVDPGVHEPEHAFDAQLWPHAAGDPQVPTLPQVWMLLPEHRVALGTHTPVQLPAVHA
jgi:hypothetical protein